MTKAVYEDPAHQFLEIPPHPLEPFFKPKSVAVIGATETPHSVGKTLMQNLIKGGFKGNLFPVNPKYSSLFDRKCFSSISEIPDPVDLAVVITPAKTVPKIIAECAAKQVPGAIIISAGFKEIGAPGKDLEDAVIHNARLGNIRLVGPNCLGIMNPVANFNATFASSMALKGNVAFVSQSGALCTAVLDWSLREKIGFSAFVSIGSMADINWGDLIDYLGRDPETRSILMYMESVGDAKNFLSAAKEVALNKPIIVIKAGRTEAAAHAAASHTGSLAGSDDVFDAAMRRVGVLRVDEIGDLFNMAEVLGKQPIPHGPRLTIVTNAGGPAVLATDAVSHFGAKMTRLNEKTLHALDEFLPPAWSGGNPIDLLGDAGPDRYAKAIQVISKDPDTDGILVVLTPQDMTDPTATAKEIVPFASALDKPILASWMGGGVVQEGCGILNDANIPTFEYPDTASKTFASMWHQSQALEALYETPEIRQEVGVVKDRIEKTEAIIQKALEEGRELLTEEESKRILEAYEIPTVQTLLAESAEEAVKAAETIGYPAVLKLHSETITHKSDVGGVLLNLQDAESIRRGFDQIWKSVAKKKGKEHFQGVTVQKMIPLDGYELILGSSVDIQFGPVILFGTGGRLVEIYRDKALGLPPLNAVLAKKLMKRTKVYKALKGVRGRGSIDFMKLEKILINFSDLISNHLHISECDINPLLASENLIMALDARIVLSKAPACKPVIRPYPSQYIDECTLSGGEVVTIRPIRPEDEPRVIQFQGQLSEKTVRGRYFKDMSYEERTNHRRMIRICHSDYDREILLIALIDDEIIAAARLKRIIPRNISDFKLVIIDRMQNRGLGTILLEKSIAIAKQEGIDRIETQIMQDNLAMKKMLKKAGFSFSPSRRNPDLINCSLVNK